MKYSHLRTILWGLSIIVLFTTDLRAQVYLTESGTATFRSEVPLHSFTGRSSHLVGRISLATDTVDFYLDLTTLDTGNGKRDKDMRRTLNTDEYPFASFYGVLITPFDPDSDRQQKATVAGDFSINGITRKVRIQGTLQKTSQGLQVSAGWTLELSDYDIEPPGILFYRVEEEQEITIEALLTPTNN